MGDYNAQNIINEALTPVKRPKIDEPLVNKKFTKLELAELVVTNVDARAMIPSIFGNDQMIGSPKMRGKRLSVQ